MSNNSMEVEAALAMYGQIEKQNQGGIGRPKVMEFYRNVSTLVTQLKNGEISDKYGIFIILDKINEQDLTFECSDTEYIQIIKEFSDSHWSKIARGIEQEFECLWRNDTMQIIIGI